MAAKPVFKFEKEVAPKKISVGLQLEPELHEQVVAFAKASGCPKSEAVRQMCRFALEHWSGEGRNGKEPAKKRGRPKGSKNRPKH